MNLNLEVVNNLPSADELQTIAYAGLLEKNGVDESHLIAALHLALGRSGSYADIYLKETISESWSLEGGVVRSGSFNCNSGFGLRVLRGEEATTASSQRIDADSLRHLSGQLSDSVSGTKVLDQGPLHELTDPHALYDAHYPFVGLQDADKIALLEKIDRMARARDPRVVEVNAMLSATYEKIWIGRCDGLSCGDVRPMLMLSVNVRVRSAPRQESASGGIGGRYGVGAWSDEQLRRLIDTQVDAALIKLDSRPAPAGKMSVVVGPGWNGVLLHEAVGHGLEADGIRRGTSAFAGRIGEKVAHDDVTIVDDGTLAGRRGSLNIDDEGNPTQRTVLIERGVLSGYMQDSLSARLMGMRPTGNGRREGYAVAPMPRMTNTFMLNGNRDPGDIIESVEIGIYVASLQGGQVDITSGQFVFEASEAFLIENGKITAPVKGATITGNGPDTIRKIRMVGNDLQLDPGRAVCGKAGQSVPVSVGQPTVRVDDMTVGGTA
ncbi:metalloprotease TldD [Burkholderia gladioli pv. gladioli]|uniref:Metalloprotease TldD n=1 Tax=Burkholderia gladioli TaxID=28095 RepID=A0A095F1M1_BURGA|nr:metalloprotease TldD [Burkholderia gladioli]AJX00821.1 modulator of DNA gyrase family protein [Burkholderia gladioli]ASD81419.1 metalloprotease TldD [Burkholderia gladioli pv. gladioli]AWY56885.1 metalloprotease TldD [Burkholderia gladioli pv. gladioli]KGC11238.1 modulator of DNA gyrase family protein [Burkholderia gladioli]MDJ1164249.1 metalloprotease TldD [Burkholderia gladioli pv. gladioli]